MAERKAQGMARLTLYTFLVTLVLALLFFLLRVVLGFPAKAVLDIFYTKWIFLTTIGDCIEAIIPLSMSAVLLSFSLFGMERLERSGKTSFYRFIGSVLVLFLVLTLVYAILQEGVRPIVYSSKEGILYITERARDYLSKADHAAEEGNFQEAVENLELYLELDPENEELRQQLLTFQSRIRPPAEQERADDGPGSRYLLSDLTPAELIEKARQFMERGDYYSAHYYATMAYGLDKTYEEAKRIASSAWERIEAVEPSSADSQTYDLYQRKKKAYKALQEDRYIEAYYLFKDLAAEYARDPDIRKYMAIAEQRAMGVSFFLDEARKALTLAGTRNILFLNRRTDTEREIIFIDKFVTVREGAFARGIEAIGFTPDGTVLYHLTAEYGKIINSALVMQCIHREDNSIRFVPEYISGQRKGMERFTIPLQPQAEQLPGFSLSPDTLRTINLPRLWENGKSLITYGYRAESLYQEILLRLLLPFTFLLANLYMAALGWRLRLRYGRLRILPFILVPLLPLLSAAVLSLYLHGIKVLLGFLLVSAGFWAAAGIMLGFQILLFLSLMSLAGQTTE